MDNVFIERRWESVKYEDIYLKAHGSITEMKRRTCLLPGRQKAGMVPWSVWGVDDWVKKDESRNAFYP
jgi:hypothetical protein